MRVLSVAGILLGSGLISGLVFGWGAVLRWLIDDDWSHLTLVGAAALCLLALLALYGTEKESDLREFVQLSGIKATAEFRPLLHFNDGTRYNILIVDVEVRFRNDSERVTRAFFPQVEILYKASHWRWAPLALERIHGAYFSIQPRGLPNQHDRWWSEGRHEIKAMDDSTGRFNMLWTTPEGSLLLLDRELKVRFTMDIIGHRTVILNKVLPKLDKEAYAASSPPPADPPPSTAS